MNLRTKLALLGVATISFSSGCRDAAGPVARGLPVPTQISKTVGPPAPRTYVLAPSPNSAVNLSQYQRDTWTTLIASGSVYMYAEPKLPNASSQYVYPGGPVGVTGWADPRTDGGCILHVKISDGLPGFGPCASAGITDTLLFARLATPRAIRGPLPNSGLYECSNYHDNCHSVLLSDFSTIVEQPIPVTLNKLKTSKRTAMFPANGGVTFTASRTPDSIWVRNGKFAHPITVTLWQWIGADSTRLTSNAYCLFATANPLCTFYPQEAGRMVVKAYTGGWEQTSSVTVQCLAMPADSALNDSTNDFQVREGLREALAASNPDSAPESGWNASSPKGWRQEVGGVIWKLPNAGGYQFVQYIDPNATACRNSLPVSRYEAVATPVPGAEPYGSFHTHPNLPLVEAVYGCAGKTMLNGVEVPFAQYPGDTSSTGALLPPGAVAVEDSARAGSNGDWNYAHNFGLPMFIMKKLDTFSSYYHR